MLAILTCVKWYLIVLISISLVISSVEQLFVSLLVICVSGCSLIEILRCIHNTSTSLGGSGVCEAFDEHARS